jgi:hypothetical protein
MNLSTYIFNGDKTDNLKPLQIENSLFWTKRRITNHTDPIPYAQDRPRPFTRDLLGRGKGVNFGGGSLETRDEIKLTVD